MNKRDKIFIAGHKGMVGSAIWRRLKSEGYTNLIGKTSVELDLRNQTAVSNFFKTERPKFVILAAARVGGIVANNTYRAEFIYDNLMISANVIHHSYLTEVKKLLFLGSSCVYPKLSPQPMKEEHLLSGYLETTNEPYAIAKISGIKLCENYRHQYGCNFISAMPTNLYGPGDNYDLSQSHVIPALFRKFHEARGKGEDVTIWGTGHPLREFMHVDDLAAASIFLMKNYSESSLINVGSGRELSIIDLAKLIGKITNFNGRILRDRSKPDGTPRKLLDSSKINQLGWKASIELEDGLRSTYNHLLESSSLFENY